MLGFVPKGIKLLPLTKEAVGNMKGTKKLKIEVAKEIFNITFLPLGIVKGGVKGICKAFKKNK